MSYIGNQPTTTAFVTDTFNGTGSTTAFTMSVAPASTTSVLVAVTGVLQDPSTYSVSGTTLTFSAAPPSGTGNISVRYLGIPASGVTTTAYRTVTEFTATAGQTSFSVPSYTVGYIDVYRNGVMLGTADFTATTGTTVVLAVGATVGDLIRTESFYVSSVLNAIPATAGAVNSTYIANSAVTTAKIADSNVTPGKLDTQAQYTGFKNRLINGAGQIWQRGTTISSIPTTGTSATYGPDRWCFSCANTGFSAVAQAVQVSNGGIRINCTTSGTPSNTGDVFGLRQIIEGLNCYDLAGQQITVSFQVKTNKTGNYGVFLYDYTGSAYGTPQSITVSSSGVTTSYSLTFTAPSSITASTSSGLGFNITLAANASRAGTWYPTAGSQANLMDSTSNYFEIYNIQLEKGSAATSFDYRPYGTELALCQRYYWKWPGTEQYMVSNFIDGTSKYNFFVATPVTMRTNPTVTTSTMYYRNGSTYSDGSVVGSGNYPNGSYIQYYGPSLPNTWGAAYPCYITTGWSWSAEL